MTARSLQGVVSRRSLLTRLGGALMAIPLLQACSQATEAILAEAGYYADVTE